MRMSFHQIAYQALEVCNPVEMATLDDRVRLTDLPPGARALDIGCGNAGVSIRLAEAFGMSVDAVELAPAMAELARARIQAAGAADGVRLHQARSSAVLAAHPAWDLIVALGVTEPVGGGVRDPLGMFAGLRPHLKPGGWMLWGDLVWLAEPAPPLRQLVEAANTYTDHEGWQAAARAAGFEVVSADVSPAETWDAYARTMQEAVVDWLAAHPDHADAKTVTASAHRLKLMFDFGQGTLGFGLYLLKV
ncbi:MAG: methyltransferase small [Brevundimonas sp.]|nr:methyltransferase small [Brevundimonas sp.]